MSIRTNIEATEGRFYISPLLVFSSTSLIHHTLMLLVKTPTAAKNPVAAGIVDNTEDYLYSSARDYYGTGKGLLDIVM